MPDRDNIVRVYSADGQSLACISCDQAIVLREAVALIRPNMGYDFAPMCLACWRRLVSWAKQAAAVDEIVDLVEELHR